MPGNTSGPRHLRFTFGDCFKMSDRQLEWRDHQLRYTAPHSICEEPRVTVITPADDAWAACKAEIDRLQVFDWQPRYQRFGLDGYAWALQLEWDQQCVACAGDNGYPTEFSFLCKPLNGLRVSTCR